MSFYDDSKVVQLDIVQAKVSVDDAENPRQVMEIYYITADNKRISDPQHRLEDEINRSGAFDKESIRNHVKQFLLGRDLPDSAITIE